MAGRAEELHQLEEPRVAGGDLGLGLARRVVVEAAP